RLQATSTRGVRARLRRVAGCATSTGFAGHAGATANLKLTFHPDHSVGANQCKNLPVTTTRLPGSECSGAVLVSADRKESPEFAAGISAETCSDCCTKRYASCGCGVHLGATIMGLRVVNSILALALLSTGTAKADTWRVDFISGHGGG